MENIDLSWKLPLIWQWARLVFETIFKMLVYLSKKKEREKEKRKQAQKTLRYL